MKTYPVTEMFHTFQGEGNHAGRDAFFVRLYGCPVHCAWCDSANTWHPNWISANIQRLDAETVLKFAKESDASRVVITGGEPAIHDLEPLALVLAIESIAVHLETSGAFPITNGFDWITVSPKWATLKNHKELTGVLSGNLEQADEWKLIVEDEHSIGRWWELLEPYHTDQSVWLHPEWSQRENPKVLESLIETVKQNPDVDFRAGWQLHKLYKADSFDARALAPVPLGGDLARGY